MPQVSRRRRLVGRLLIGAAVLALPLTGSITYAASDQPAAPAPPSAPDIPLPPHPPLPVVPPSPPSSEADHPGHRVIVIREHSGKDASQTRTVTRGNTTVTVTTDHSVSDAEIDRIVRDSGREAARGQAEAMRGHAEAMRAEALAETGAARAEAAQGRAEAARERAIARAGIIRIHDNAMGHAHGCRNGAADVTSSDPDGSHVIRIKVCARAAALDGLRHARQAIEQSTDIPSEGRARALHELDARISEVEKAG